MTKKFTFDDLQPHVDMLIDALENKGASSSGIPYNKEVYEYSQKYREVLNQIRTKSVTLECLVCDLHLIRNSITKVVGNNQTHRVYKIVNALDVFMIKEYNKYFN